MRLVVLVFLIGLSCSTKNSYNDKEQIERQVASFLTWYSNNLDSISNKLLNPVIDNIWREPPDSTKPYKINFENGEVYLTAFRRSGFISERYINNFRDYFKECQVEFENNPQYFGPPKGFDLDLVFRMQDKVKSPRARVTDLMIESDKAVATVKLSDTPPYYYLLTKKEGKWLIDDIKGTWEN